MGYVLNEIASLWRNRIKVGLDCQSRKRFMANARDAMRFYSEPHDFLYSSGYSSTSMGFASQNLPEPTFKATVNKCAELVDIYLPVLYHRNPTRTVAPKYPEIDPQLLQAAGMMGVVPGKMPWDIPVALRASLLQHVLNYTPNELNLKENARNACLEALLKGRGIVWTEVVQQGGVNMVGSFMDSIDHLVIDPDCEDIRDAKWVARKRCRKVYDVEIEYGLPPGSLRGSLESGGRQAELNASEYGTYDRQTTDTKDLLFYWEVYSRCGFGHQGGESRALDQVKDRLSQYGDYVYLVIPESGDYPLNLPPFLAEAPGSETEIFTRIQWHTPFYKDRTHPWPFVHLDFHPVPRSPWPQAHITPAMGHLKFLDWAYSFLAGKVRNTCRDFLVIPKRAEQELVDTIMSGSDLALIRINSEHKGTVEEIVQFLQHPQMNGDILKVLQMVEYAFDKATGLTELAYGMTSQQMRSAAEAQVKQNNMNVRPDDMAQRVENWMAQVARNEAICIQAHMGIRDVAPIFGEQVQESRMGDVPSGPYSMLWTQSFANRTIDQIVSEFDYRIESGSARKPNKELQVAQAQEGINLFGPMFKEFYQATGNPAQLNSLISYWAKANDWPDPTNLMFPDMSMQIQQQQQAMMAQQPALDGPQEENPELRAVG